jgi:hypothetical protein
MFISIRKYKAVSSVDEMTRRVEQGFVPLLKDIPGFLGYHFLDCGGVVVSISMFDRRESALASNDRAREWVRDNVAEFLPEPPEILAGSTVIDVTTP